MTNEDLHRSTGVLATMIVRRTLGTALQPNEFLPSGITSCHTLESPKGSVARDRTTGPTTRCRRFNRAA